MLQSPLLIFCLVGLIMCYPEQWLNISPRGVSPRGRESSAVATIEEEDVMYVFGGNSGVSSLSCTGVETSGTSAGSDLWQFSFFGNYWTFVNVTAGGCPTPRSLHSLMRIGVNSLLLFGGFNDDTSNTLVFGDLWSFQFRGTQQQWTQISCPVETSCPTPRHSHSMISAADNGTTFGTAIMHGGRDASGVYSDMWRWEISNGWSLLRAVNTGPIARYGHTIRISNGVLYVFGGAGQSDTVLNDLWSLNLSSFIWTQLHSDSASPPARVYHTAEFLTPWRILIVAGEGGSGVGESNTMADSWVFDTRTSSWSLSSLPESSPSLSASRMTSARGFNNKISIFGGRTVGQELSNDVTLVDIFSAETLVVPGDLPPPRWASVGALISQTFFIFGGISNTGILGDSWVFNTSTKIWKSISLLGVAPSPRAFASGMGWGTEMVFFGGETAAGKVSDVWLAAFLDSNSPTWIQLIPDSVIPPSGRSRFVSLVDSSAGTLYIHGGISTTGNALSDVWSLDLKQKTTDPTDYTLYFDGEGAYALADLTDPNAVPINTNSSTVVSGAVVPGALGVLTVEFSARIPPISAARTEQVVLDLISSAGDGGPVIRISTLGNGSVSVSSSAGWVVASAVKIDDDKWHHVAVVTRDFSPTSPEARPSDTKSSPILFSGANCTGTSTTVAAGRDVCVSAASIFSPSPTASLPQDTFFVFSSQCYTGTAEEFAVVDPVERTAINVPGAISFSKSVIQTVGSTVLFWTSPTSPTNIILQLILKDDAGGQIIFADPNLVTQITAVSSPAGYGPTVTVNYFKYLGTGVFQANVSLPYSTLVTNLTLAFATPSNSQLGPSLSIFRPGVSTRSIPSSNSHHEEASSAHPHRVSLRASAVPLASAATIIEMNPAAGGETYYDCSSLGVTGCQMKNGGQCCTFAASSSPLPVSMVTNSSLLARGWAKKVLIYIDGILVKSEILRVEGTDEYSAAKLGLGNYPDIWKSPSAPASPVGFKGYIDELRLWNLERSQGEIAQNMLVGISADTLAVASAATFSFRAGDSNSAMVKDRSLFKFEMFLGGDSVTRRPKLTATTFPLSGTTQNQYSRSVGSWRQLTPIGAGVGRLDHVIVWSGVLRAIIHGGRTGVGGEPLASIWELKFSQTSVEFTQRNSTAPSLYGHSAVSVGLSSFLLFGGSTTRTLLSDNSTTALRSYNATLINFSSGQPTTATLPNLLTVKFSLAVSNGTHVLIFSGTPTSELSTTGRSGMKLFLLGDDTPTENNFQFASVAPPTPAPRGFAAFIASSSMKFLAVAGGVSAQSPDPSVGFYLLPLGDFWRLDIVSATWRKINLNFISSVTQSDWMKRRHAFAAAVFIEGSSTMFIFGGVETVGSETGYSTLKGISNALWSINLSNEIVNFGMIRSSDWPAPRCRHAMATLGGGSSDFIFIFGGQTAAGPSTSNIALLSGPTTNDLWVFRARTCLLQDRCIMQKIRAVPTAKNCVDAPSLSGHTMVAFQGPSYILLLVSGGFSSTSASLSQSLWLAKVSTERFSAIWVPLSNSALANFPAPRINHAAFLFSRKIDVERSTTSMLLFGGSVSGGGASREVLSIDLPGNFPTNANLCSCNVSRLSSLSSLSWNLYPATGDSVPSGRSGASVGILGTKIIIFGGVDSAGNYLSDFWTWEIDNPLPARCFISHFSPTTIAGYTSTFEINSYNIMGAKKTAAIFDINIKSSAVSLLPSVSETSPGTYLVSFKPKIAGAYAVVVLWRGEPLPSSPLSLIVSPARGNPGRTSASGVGISRAIAGLISIFTITVFDVFANQVNNFSDVSVTLASGQLNIVGVPVNQLDGTYSVSFVCTISGVYSTSILLFSSHISGSPFNLSVSPAIADVTKTLAFGTGLSNSVAGTSSIFYIQTQDSYGNNMTSASEQITFSIVNPTQPTVLLTDIETRVEYISNGLFKLSYYPYFGGVRAGLIIVHNGSIIASQTAAAVRTSSRELLQTSSGGLTNIVTIADVFQAPDNGDKFLLLYLVPLVCLAVGLVAEGFLRIMRRFFSTKKYSPSAAVAPRLPESHESLLLQLDTLFLNRKITASDRAGLELRLRRNDAGLLHALQLQQHHENKLAHLLSAHLRETGNAIIFEKFEELPEKPIVASSNPVIPTATPAPARTAFREPFYRTHATADLSAFNIPSPEKETYQNTNVGPSHRALATLRNAMGAETLLPQIPQPATQRAINISTRSNPIPTQPSPAVAEFSVAPISAPAPLQLKRKTVVATVTKIEQAQKEPKSKWFS